LSQSFVERASAPRASADLDGLLKAIAARLQEVNGIKALVLGGSRARGTADAHSDVDLGIYYDSSRPFSLKALEAAARDLDDLHRKSLVTHFGEWGPGVNGGGWLTIGGHHVDFLFRDLRAVRAVVADVIAGRVNTVYQLGHPMGFHNQIYAGEALLCVPIFDRGARLNELKARLARYPERYRRAVVVKHMFDAQFELAIAGRPAMRGDVPYVAGCIFRGAGFMTTVLYALNRKWMLNEKGAFLESRGFKIKPRGFHAAIARAFSAMGAGPDSLKHSLKEVNRARASLERLVARLIP
jgi:predicted nucleotidyltransferase